MYTVDYVDNIQLIYVLYILRRVLSSLCSAPSPRVAALNVQKRLNTSIDSYKESNDVIVVRTSFSDDCRVLD